MSIPRFSNPHLLLSASRSITRKDLVLDSDGEESDDALVTSLNEKIRKSIDVENEATSRKRQKTSEPVKEQENEQLLFRLWSTSSHPQPVKLYPEHSTQVLINPPRQHEDSEPQSRQRRERAEDIAVDIAWIHAESKRLSMPFPSSSKKLIHAKAPSLTHMRCLMIAQVLQPVRKTHPPVPYSAMVYHPYTVNASLPPSPSDRRFVDIELLSGSPVVRTKRSRHRRNPPSSCVIAFMLFSEVAL
ncbi:hypothetical protein F5146DRAFT_1208409 [Armillaria mellea]|nr:hypothetical protein F5146DRAFT_1208409 [Armillaria mellea]